MALPTPTVTDEVNRLWEETKAKNATPVVESTLGPSAGTQASISKYTGIQAPTAMGGGPMSDADFQNSLLKSATGGKIAKFQTDLSAINTKLTTGLSDLTAERTALTPGYENQLGEIKQNQFNSSEATKEMMNQGGWNAGNSGLAIGEQTKIGVAADKSRATAQQNLVNSMADIQRRMTNMQQTSSIETQALEQWLSGELSSAEAEAMLQSDSRSREQAAAKQDQANQDRAYNRSVLEADRDYNLRLKAARSSGSGGGSSKKAASIPAAQQSADVDELIAGMQSLSPQKVIAIYDQFMGDPDYSNTAKKRMKDKYGSTRDMIYSDYQSMQY